MEKMFWVSCQSVHPVIVILLARAKLSGWLRYQDVRRKQWKVCN